LQRTAFGTPTDEFAEDPEITDASTLEYVAWVPMLVLIVVLGIYPNLLFKVTDEAVEKSLHECLSVEVDDVVRIECGEVYELDIVETAAEGG
jgi:NADH:ubiquinone oxidoreductase subunit 4 (subunit M)